MIYYSHVNEDNRVERELMTKGHFSSLWGIAGSGERVISLMDTDGIKNDSGDRY